MKLNQVKNKHARGAYTLVEVVIAVFVLAIMTISLYGGFSAGFAVVQVARENLRATQIILQKMETVRLYNWSQVLNTNNYLKPSFTNYYDPANKSGTLYRGFVTTATPGLTGVGYSNDMRRLTVTLYWTNYQHGSTNKIVRSRQMQTYIARYGMQNYLYMQ
jgi:type II secretory pathway pseudopilin PulG